MEISLQTFSVILGVVYIIHVCMEHLNKINQSINQTIHRANGRRRATDAKKCC